MNKSEDAHLTVQICRGFTAAQWESLKTRTCTYPAGKCIKPPMSDAFKTFLKRPAFRSEFRDDKVASKFVGGIRNGILHEAETRRWVIWRDEPVGQIVQAEGRGYALNRTEFVTALTQEFKSYLGELADPSNATLRKRFVHKMNDIVKNG